MKRKQDAGSTLIEVVVSIALLGALVVPTCTRQLTSLRMNERADELLQAQLAVSSAVETLMAEGITEANDAYDKLSGTDRFENVTVKTETAYKLDSVYNETTEPLKTCFKVTVISDIDSSVSVTTYIRKQVLNDETE